MAAKKEPFGGKQAPAFGQGKKEQKNAKARPSERGRERQETDEKKKKVK
jgi:hypothetical protein